MIWKNVKILQNDAFKRRKNDTVTVMSVFPAMLVLMCQNMLVE